MVGHAMQAELVGHISDHIFLMYAFRLYLHGLLRVTVGKIESGLGEAAMENLHQAVGITVIVDRAALTRRPYEYELSTR
jgi:hypothetical protein